MLIDGKHLAVWLLICGPIEDETKRIKEKYSKIDGPLTFERWFAQKWDVFGSILKAFGTLASCWNLTESIWSGRMSLFMAIFLFRLFFRVDWIFFWSATANVVRFTRWRCVYGFFSSLFTLLLFPFARAVCTHGQYRAQRITY